MNAAGELPRPEDIAAVNAVAAFLALDDFGEAPAESDAIDCIVLAGNSVLHTAEAAFRLARSNPSSTLLISGGIGHSTHLLYQQVGLHPMYGTIATDGRA